ncbi:MAG: tetratricopeptide repeat protein [Selenomonadaceae bacterium]|nr:tetratricopeptide repeat protein [Selenomonadaceae bacterium]
MKKFLAAMLAAGSLFLMPTVNAEIKTCTGTDEYIMSEFETIDIAKQRAKQKAERVAQEQAGVFVESNTEVVNMMVTKDEIRTITCGILKVTDVQYKLTPLDDGKSLIVRATVTADVDTDDVKGWFNRDQGERSDLVEKNLELQKAIAEQDAQIAELKRQLAEKPQDSEKFSAQFAAEDKNFLSNQKLEEAVKFYSSGDMNSTVSFCSQAIELNPSNATAYSIRGAIFYWQKNFNSALADFNKAIEFNPSDYKNFYNRGLAYVKLQNYRAAADDFNSALRLNPNDGDSRYNLELCYRAMRR